MSESRESTLARGFSLIELMVVIAIIGILSAMVVVSLSGARAEGRDAQRLSDVKQIALSITLYYEACDEYPASLDPGENNGCPGGTDLSDFISSVPDDPLGGSYLYGVASGNSSFVVGATFEKAVNLPNDDLDGTIHGVNCNGSVYCQSS